MPKLRPVVSLVALCMGLCAHATGPAATDDRGRLIALPRPAERVVSLAPHVTEILFALGAGARVVGVIAGSDFPAAAARLPVVGGAGGLDIERILGLDPDLVVAWGSGNPPRQLARIESLGLSVFWSEPRRLRDVPATMRRLGVLVGAAEAGRAQAARFRSRLAAIAARYSHRPELRVFYQVWHRPLVTLNGEHLVSDLIRLCGGTNVFAELPSLAPQIDPEAVLAADPQVIVASGATPERPQWLDAWRDWPGLAAARHGTLYAIPPDLIQRHGPRLLDGAAALCAHLDDARRRLGRDRPR